MSIRCVVQDRVICNGVHVSELLDFLLDVVRDLVMRVHPDVGVLVGKEFDNDAWRMFALYLETVLMSAQRDRVGSKPLQRDECLLPGLETWEGVDHLC